MDHNSRKTRIVRESGSAFHAVKRPSSKDIKQENLKTLSRNKILTSIKGHDIVTKKQKLIGNNSHLDLVNMNAYMKFGEFLLIFSQDIERIFFFRK